MNSAFKKKITKRDLPPEFSDLTFKTITRIEENPHVYGVLYFCNNQTQLCTLPENMAHVLNKKLPQLNLAARRAVTEIDVLDELVAYRIETNRTEIAVAVGKEFEACVVHKSPANNKGRRNKITWKI